MTRDHPHRGRSLRKLSPEQELALQAHIRSRPGITLAQAQAWLLADHGTNSSIRALWNAAKRRGLSFDKALYATTGPAGRGGTSQAVVGSAAVHRS